MSWGDPATEVLDAYVRMAGLAWASLRYPSHTTGSR